MHPGGGRGRELLGQEWQTWPAGKYHQGVRKKESAVSSLQGDESERSNTAMDKGTTKEPGT